jgi:hypothetical protein
LFATGEQGAWYDPSDLTTLFQDSAGTTPVTAAAQQVGLALDKSQGLVLGPELIPNGDFSNGSANWTTGTGWSISGGSAQGTAVAGADLTSSFTTTAGRWYQLTFTVSNYIAGIFRPSVGQSETINVSANGTYTYRLFAASSTAVKFFGFSSFTGSIDNVSAKLLPGNHAFQSTSAQRPTLGRNPYTGTRNLLTFTEQFDNAVWVKAQTTVTANATTAPDGTSTADKMLETAVTNAHAVYANFTYVAGATYAASVYAKAAERSWIYLGADTSAAEAVFFDLATGTVGNQGTGYVGSIQSVGDGWYRCTVIITQATALPPNFLVVGVTSANNTTSYAGVATSGVFIWGAQLETNATATAYQRVVSSFDVTEAGVPDVWYLSFDGTDDGMLTGTITPGIDKMQIFSGVRKLSDAAATVVAELSVASSTNNGSFGLFAPDTPASATYRFRTRGTTTSDATSAATFAAPITNVITGIGDIAADTAILRANGAVASTSAVDQGTGNYLAYPLYIGRRAGSTLPLNGRIYSMIVRFGANLSASTILQTETWVGDKTGINIPLSVSPTIYDRFNDTVLDRAGQTIEVR